MFTWDRRNQWDEELQDLQTWADRNLEEMQFMEPKTPPQVYKPAASTGRWFSTASPVEPRSVSHLWRIDSAPSACTKAASSFLSFVLSCVLLLSAAGLLLLFYGLTDLLTYFEVIVLWVSLHQHGSPPLYPPVIPPGSDSFSPDLDFYFENALKETLRDGGNTVLAHWPDLSALMEEKMALQRIRKVNQLFWGAAPGCSFDSIYFFLFGQCCILGSVCREAECNLLQCNVLYSQTRDFRKTLTKRYY